MIWLYVLFAAVMWRLGGGAFTSLTAAEIGTDEARLFRAAVAIIFPFFLPFASSFAPAALLLGVVLAGWGPFQGMGSDPATTVPEKTWQGFLPRLLGFQPLSFAYDYFGMMVSGILCMAPLAAILLISASWHVALAVLLSGLLFSPCYALARLIPANIQIKNFASGQEWGEVFVGAMLGIVFVLSVTL